MRKVKQLTKPSLLLLLIVSLGSTIFVALGQDEEKWLAPASADKLKNPYNGNVNVLAEGKKIFNSMCAVCHGESGKGNGEASVTMDPRPANFLSIEVEHESDGAVFWKMTEGNPPMASYKTLLTEDQRWKLVTYIRSLEEKSKSSEKKH